jgi:hypothetical protein
MYFKLLDHFIVSGVATVRLRAGRKDDRGSVPGKRRKDFSYSLYVQTDSGWDTQHTVQWVQRVLSPGLKRGRGVTLTTDPPTPNVLNSRMRRSYTYSHLGASVTCSGTSIALDHSIRDFLTNRNIVFD